MTSRRASSHRCAVDRHDAEANGHLMPGNESEAAGLLDPYLTARGAGPDDNVVYRTEGGRP